MRRFDFGSGQITLEQFNINKDTRKVISFLAADIELFLPYKISICFGDFIGIGIGNFNEKLQERINYIVAELRGRWHGYHSVTVNGYIIHFELEEDAIMFKLRW